ncbi:hypothetical protein LTR22_004181 [Elasticomyces elasticus]|nr:hypothetical protein LTR22_004181 [Elasticomyces elasticus]KAK4912762.1 hypothetical protein LTR49_018831 [Elasticomyces elasticus]
MSVTSLAFQGPLPPSFWVHEHPALHFYRTYLKDFGENYSTAQPEAYYAKDYGSVIDGGIWEYVGRELYGGFQKVSREMLSLIVVSNDEAGTHDIHINLVTSLHKSEHNKVDLPQAFTYTLGKADEAKGTLGLQFRKLRCYYDWSILKQAKAQM